MCWMWLMQFMQGHAEESNCKVIVELESDKNGFMLRDESMDRDDFNMYSFETNFSLMTKNSG